MYTSVSGFSGESGIYEMPQARLIGIRHKHLPGSEGHMRLHEFLEVTLKSKAWNETIMKLPNIIPNEAIDFTCEYVAETDSFSFIEGVLTPEGTPVPQGLDFRDVASTLVWIWKIEAGKDALTELNKHSDTQYVANFDAPGFPWQGFLRANTYSVLPVRMRRL